MRLNRLGFWLAGFVVAGLGGLVLAQSAPPQSKPAPAEDEFLKGAYVYPMEGLTAPKAIKQAHPKYTPNAMRLKIQGMVKLQIVIDANGTVDRARVVQSLHPELDAQAIAILKMWAFEPGKYKDKPVPVVMSLDFDFRLH